MPTLKKIVVQDFRNIELQELEFSPNINCISGENGEGKTNLLDAIWYLSMTKSAFASTDRYNFRHGCKSFALSGEYLLPDGRSSRVSIEVGEKEKKIRKDDKNIASASDYIGFAPVVMVSPSDTAMISDSGDMRRRFVNSVISQMDKSYLIDAQDYNRLLATRNAYLKNAVTDDTYLDVLDEKMSVVAARISSQRREFVSRLAPLLQKYYSEISGGRENVSISYKSDVEDGNLADMLREKRAQDRLLKFTSVGVQRDDFIFEMDGYPIRKCGSQGQQKSFLVALKFAQYELMKMEYGYAPILLLDDLFDKLDMNRVSNLLRMVSGTEFGQIFLSDSNKIRLGKIVDDLTSDRTYHTAKGGVFINE